MSTPGWRACCTGSVNTTTPQPSLLLVWLACCACISANASGLIYYVAADAVADAAVHAPNCRLPRTSPSTRASPAAACATVALAPAAPTAAAASPPPGIMTPTAAAAWDTAAAADLAAAAAAAARLQVAAALATGAAAAAAVTVRQQQQTQWKLPGSELLA